MTPQRIEPMRITINNDYVDENSNSDNFIVDRPSFGDQSHDKSDDVITPPEDIINIYSTDDEFEATSTNFIGELIPEESYPSKRSLSKWFQAKVKYDEWIFPCSRHLDTIIISDSHLKMFDRRNVQLPGKSINAYSGAGWVS